MDDAPLWPLAHLALAYAPGTQALTRAVAPVIRRRDGMYDTELARLHQAVQADPADVEARLALLQGLIAAEQWAEAEQVGRGLLRDEAVQTTVQGWMGIGYCKQGRWDSPVHQGYQALARPPDDALGLFNLGIAQPGQGDAKAALEYLERATAQEPQWAEAHYSVGTLLLQQ